MIHYYKALNFLKLNDREAALVECKRMNIKLNRLSDKYKSDNKYKKDAFIQILMGIIYDANDDYNCREHISFPRPSSSTCALYRVLSRRGKPLTRYLLAPAPLRLPNDDGHSPCAYTCTALSGRGFRHCGLQAYNAAHRRKAYEPSMGRHIPLVGAAP